MWLHGPLHWEPRRWHKAYGKLEASSKGSYLNNWVNRAVQCHSRQGKAQGVLREKSHSACTHNLACTHKWVSKPSTECSFPPVTVVQVLLKNEWAISDSTSIRNRKPWEKCIQLNTLFSKSSKEFLYKNLPLPVERNGMPLPACTSPASLSNKGRLVSHPNSNNLLLAATNPSFDLHRKCFSMSQPECTCLAVETQSHPCQTGVNTGRKSQCSQASATSEIF